MAENKKVKVGVFGAGRGGTMMKYCSYADNAELVAICDNYLPLLEKAKKECQDGGMYLDSVVIPRPSQDLWKNIL